MEQKEKKERKEKKRRREKCAKETVIFPRSSLLLLLLPFFSFPFSFSPPLLFSLPPLPRKRRRTYVTVVWRHISQRRRDTSHIVRIRLRCFSRLLDTSRKNTRASHASGKPLYNGSSWFLRLVKCARFEPIFPPSPLTRKIRVTKTKWLHACISSARTHIDFAIRGISRNR